MNPTRRIATAIIGALVLGGVITVVVPIALRALATQRASCLGPASDALPGRWCALVVRYPNRLPIVSGLLLGAVLVVLGVLAARWCLRPVRDLLEVVDQLGPTNLGHRTGMGKRRDELGRLGRGLDAMMDRIASSYDSQRRFAANASHELRTPLAVQRTLIEVGMAEPLTGDQLALLTSQLLTTNQRNERLIEGLLTLAEAEQTPVGHTPQRLDQIARAVVEAYEPRARDSDVALTLESTPTTITGEQVLIERLVTNLVQNAIAYNVPGGTVTIMVESGAVAVTNTGRPVPTDEVGSLFEPFHRGTGERLTHGGGAGLGLTITRAIAAAHHAAITAVPGASGGLTVRVAYPGEDAGRG